MNIKQMIIVGMADLNACKAPGVLTTLGLGSCVGIALYDPMAKVAGLAHCMLPDSTKIAQNSVEAKFVDTAVAKLLMQMQRLGANKRLMKAKVAGGAQMFAFGSTNDMMRIGDRNIEATIRILGMHGIPILAKDVGLTYGRTVELYSDTGAFLIKTIGHGNKSL